MNLIERLRSRVSVLDVDEVADALEAQARQIADLQSVIEGYQKSGEVFVETINKKSARIAELEAALRFYLDADNWLRNGPLDPNSNNFTGGPAADVLGEKE